MPVFSRNTKTVQFADDGPGALGGGDDGKVLTWDNGTGKFIMATGGGGGNIAYTDVVNTFARQQIFHPAVADIQLGDEAIVDSTFPDLTNWVDDSSGWNALNPGLSHTPGASGELTQALTLTPVPNVYVLSVVVSGMTAGWVDVYDDYNLDCYTEENGTFTDYTLILDYQASDTIYIDVSADFDGVIESVSLKPSVDGASLQAGWPATVLFNHLNGDPVTEMRFISGIFAGFRAGRFSTGSDVGIGDFALDSVTTEGGNLGIGPSAGKGMKAANAICIGNSSGRNSTGNGGIYIGTLAGDGETSGDRLHIGANGDLISGTMDGGNAATQTLKFHAATINMADLPTSSAGLSSGDLWNNSGVLNVA